MCTGDVSAGLALGLVQQYAQGRAQTQAVRSNTAGLTTAMSQDMAALAARQRQSSKQSREKVGLRAKEAEREIGRINAIVSDSGIKGRTADMLRQEVLAARDSDVSALQENAGAVLAQSRREIESTRTRYSNAIRGQTRTSVLGSVLDIGGQALNQKGPTLTDIGSSIRRNWPESQWEPTDPNDPYRG